MLLCRGESQASCMTVWVRGVFLSCSSMGRTSEWETTPWDGNFLSPAHNWRLWQVKPFTVSSKQNHIQCGCVNWGQVYLSLCGSTNVRVMHLMHVVIGIVLFLRLGAWFWHTSHFFWNERSMSAGNDKTSQKSSTALSLMSYFLVSEILPWEQALFSQLRPGGRS